MKQCNTVPHFWVHRLPEIEDTCPHAIYFVRAIGGTSVKCYVTDRNGESFFIGESTITSSDSSITIEKTQTNFDLKIADGLKALIINALQSGSNISELINDVGFITAADIPSFVPSDYDLAEFSNSSTDPFVKQSEISAGATNLSYVASPSNGTVVSDTGNDATIPMADGTNAGLSINNYTSAEKTKLLGIEAGAEVNNISDVNATDLTDGGDTSLHTHDDRYYTETEVNTLLSNKFDTPSGSPSDYLDGEGNPQPFPTSSGTVTNVTGTTDEITVANGTTTPNIGISPTYTAARNSYADTKVENNLTASTTVAPSKSAVNTALATKQNLFEKIGVIYSSNSWANLTDFTSDGATVTVSSNKLSFTTVASSNPAAGANGQPPMLRLNTFTGLDRWTVSAKIRINQTPSTTSYGFSVGVVGNTSLGNSSESAALAFFNTTTNGTLKGKVSCMVGTQNNIVGSSTQILTFSQNDLIDLRVERTLSNIVVSARNITTGSAVVSFSYNYNTNFADGTTNPFLPNSGNVVIGQHGGSFLVEELIFKSDQIKRADLMVISDSKGIYNAPQDLSFVSLLKNKYRNVIWNGGPIDITQGVVSKLPEILALNPKQVVLAIGRNDLITGISSATWQANMVTIDTALTGAGISVYWTNGFKESASQATLKSYIETQFSGRVINTFDSTDFAACLSADSIHPSVSGHEIIANTIINSGFITDYSVEEQNNFQKSQSFQDVRYAGQILASSGTVQKPTTSNNGDIIVPDGGGIRAAYQGTPSWNSAVLPFVGGNFRMINTFSASNKYSFQFSGSGGTNGSEVTTAVISDTGNMILRPTASPNPLLRTDFSTSGMYLTGADKGLGGFYYPPNQSTVGQTGRIIPFTSTYASEIRNYSRIGKIDTYVSNGTDDNQFLAETVDAKGSVSFFGEGVQMPNLTTSQRDALGKVIGLSMNTVGAGITTATVAFSGGGGTGAAGTVNVSGGIITGVTMTNSGSGYTSAPTATFSGDGNASSVSASVVGSYLRGGLMIFNTTTKKIEYWNETSWISLP